MTHATNSLLIPQGLEMDAPRTVFLNEHELVDLTGKVRHSAQVRQLNYMGITHKVRADGSVAVLRMHVEQSFGLTGALARKRTEPDFSSWRS